MAQKVASDQNAVLTLGGSTHVDVGHFEFKKSTTKINNNIVVFNGGYIYNRFSQKKSMRAESD